ncbi:hypothetical protein CCP4SC76_5550007 [Gammaproteobacteria bacterium]
MGGLVVIAASNALLGGGIAATAAVATLGIGVLVVASVAGRIAHAWLEAEKARGEAAKQDYEQQRQAFHDQQLQQQGQLALALGAALEKIQLSAPQGHGGHAETGGGFLASSPRQQQQKQLAAIAEALDAIPPSWRQAHSKAWADLQRQWQSQQSQPNSQILATLQKNLQNTLAQALDEAVQQQQWGLEAQALFHELAALQAATPAPFKPNYQPLLAQIRDSLDNHPEQLRQLVTWREQKMQLQQQTRQWQEQMAVRHALIERIKFHLDAKGYQYLGKGRFRLPLGEQVQIQFDHQGQMTLRLIHERAQATQAPLSADEYAFFQQQEQHWHQDLEQLMPALVADGFPVVMAHHEALAAEAVSLAFLDRADQWYQEAERAHQPLHRSQP